MTGHHRCNLPLNGSKKERNTHKSVLTLFIYKAHTNDIANQEWEEGIVREFGMDMYTCFTENG